MCDVCGSVGEGWGGIFVLGVGLLVLVPLSSFLFSCFFVFGFKVVFFLFSKVGRRTDSPLY